MSKRVTPKLPAVRTAEGGIRLVGGRELRIDHAYFVQDVHPRGAGPWLLETDKLAWTDQETCYGCIVLRSPRTGALGAYVGVDPGHPLHGFTAEALTSAFDVRVHGGVTYSAICQPDQEEARSICHPSDTEARRRRRAARAAHHDHRWWFGCTADQPYDLLPPVPHGDGYRPARVDDKLTRPKEYRTEAYMIEQATSLAAQIHAIATGRPMPEKTSAPPVGVDPRQSKGGW